MIQRLQVKRNEKGFTLIELLIVIIVLGILAAIVVFAVGSTRKDSVSAACKTTVKSVELSAEAVNTTLGSYPGQGADPADLMNSKNATPLIAANANGALLKDWPSSSDYFLQYKFIANADPTKPGNYQVNVFPAKGNVEHLTDGTVRVGTQTGLAATEAGVSSAGCTAL